MIKAADDAVRSSYYPFSSTSFSEMILIQLKMQGVIVRFMFLALIWRHWVIKKYAQTAECRHHLPCMTV